MLNKIEVVRGAYEKTLQGYLGLLLDSTKVGRRRLAWAARAPAATNLTSRQHQTPAPVLR
jgi:hypothetical protein